VIALYDFEPRFCPNCGDPIPKHDRTDWRAHAAHRCLNCTVHYQLADREEIKRAAAASGGDLVQWCDR
jgi:endogenous inhibitor of DNA gyrase (YacG/DUF329 family)